jgi:hypothetical protein
LSRSSSSKSSSSSCKIKERGEDKAGDPDLSDLHQHCTSTATSSLFNNLQVLYLLILIFLFIYLLSIFTLSLFIRFPLASSALVFATLE